MTWCTRLMAPLLIIAAISGCESPVPGPAGVVVEEELIAKGERIAMVQTDKARYHPGEAVRFSATMAGTAQPSRLIVRYKHLNRVVHEQTVEAAGPQVVWEWTPPPEDFQGYMAEIFAVRDGKAEDKANIAVDVSSDWTRFPRYGFLSNFSETDEERTAAVLDRLNRHHINGIQFYDWQYKHHQPVKRDGAGPAAEWKDIANRPVSLATVRRYIDQAHERNMAAMNYNLLFGAYEDAEADGVSRDWGMFADPLGERLDKHPLPDSWASDIVLMNPANEEWRRYIFREMRYAFEQLPFDGWHVDQLGSRGARFDRRGVRIELSKSYGAFLSHAKRELGKTLVMNAVDQYGQAYIAQAPVSFLYTEVWGTYPGYGDLKEVIDANARLGGGRLGTVLAAYMNYRKSEMPGTFNTPGVLLTNAVIFASGGAHLELGEHMLSREYFPHDNLRMTEELEARLVDYYDFLVAYQNLLRGGLEPFFPKVASADVAWSGEAESGKVWLFGKRSDARDVIHLINFKDAVTMEWNDADGIQTEPAVQSGVRIALEPEPADGRAVKEVWTASPDFAHGSAREAEFSADAGGRLEIVLDRLQYWSMIVIEYE